MGFDPGQAEELHKALTAGSDQNHPGTMTSGSSFALRPESLDPVLFNLSFRMEHIKLWPALYKQTVGNVINEYNTLEEHGSGTAFFHEEGALPQEDDSKWDRKYARVKCMGTVRRTTILAQSRNLAHMRAEAHQVAGGTMWMLQQLEVALFEGDSALSSVQFDGLKKQIHTDNVIDMRGAPLTGEVINAATAVVKGRPNYGLATDLHLPLEAFTDLADDVAPGARYNVNPEGYKSGIAGVPVKGWNSQNGVIKFNDNVFLRFGEVAPAAAVGDAAKRPSAPTLDTALASSGTGSQFKASDAGAYRYRAVACNKYGKSVVFDVTGSVTVAAGETVTFKLADGSPVAEWYEIYRTDKGAAAATARLMTRVPRDASGVTTITDANADLPGCADAYLIQQNREFMVWHRLLKFLKLPLARIDTSDRFLLLLFGNLVIHANRKGIRLKNVGRASRTVTIPLP